MNQNSGNCNSNDGPWYNPENSGKEKTSQSGYETQNNYEAKNFLEEAEENALTFGIASMIIGIFSLLGEKLLFGIAGLVLGKISEKKKPNTYAKVGVICSIISIVIGAVFIVAFLIIFSLYGAVFFRLLNETLENF